MYPVWIEKQTKSFSVCSNCFEDLGKERKKNMREVSISYLKDSAIAPLNDSVSLMLFILDRTFKD